MSTPAIEQTLKGLQELRSADLAELKELLRDLQAQARDIEFQTFVLKRLVEEAEAEQHSGVGRGAGTPPRDRPEARHDERPSSWKGDAIRAFLSEHPDQMFTAAEVRSSLRARSVMQGDEGTPTSVLLRRLADRGQVKVDESGSRYGHGLTGPQASQITWNGGP